MYAKAREKYELQDHYASDELATTLAAGGFALDAGSGCYYSASSGLWCAFRVEPSRGEAREHHRGPRRGLFVEPSVEPFAVVGETL